MSHTLFNIIFNNKKKEKRKKGGVVYTTRYRCPRAALNVNTAHKKIAVLATEASSRELPKLTVVPYNYLWCSSGVASAD